MWAQEALLCECQSGPRVTREDAGAVEETRDNGGLATDGVGRLQAPTSTRNPLPTKPSATLKDGNQWLHCFITGFSSYLYTTVSPQNRCQKCSKLYCAEKVTLTGLITETELCESINKSFLSKFILKVGKMDCKIKHTNHLKGILFSFGKF